MCLFIRGTIFIQINRRGIAIHESYNDILETILEKRGYIFPLVNLG